MPESPESKCDEGEEEVLAKQLRDEDSSSDELLAADEDIVEHSERIIAGAYVLVKFPLRKSISYFVGIVLETDGITCSVSFFQHIRGVAISFVKSEPEDVSEIDLEDVVMVLPPPNKTGAILYDEMTLPLDFCSFKMCFYINNLVQINSVKISLLV